MIASDAGFLAAALFLPPVPAKVLTQLRECVYIRSTLAAGGRPLPRVPLGHALLA